MTAPQFSIEYWMISFIENAAGSIEGKSLVSQRSDGSRCERVLQPPPGPPSSLTRTLYLADGRRIEINDSKRLRTTYPLSNEQLAGLKGLVSADASRRDCGREREVFEGYTDFLDRKVEIWRTEFLTDHQKSVVRMTSYRSPDLACQDLKLMQEEKGLGGEYVAKWTKDAQSITLDPPLDEEMDPAHSYLEVPPSEFLRHTHMTAALVLEAVETQRCKKMRCSETELEAITKGYRTLAEADEAYRRSRVARQ